MDLKDKIAVVTGASDGIGRQISLKLAEKGVNLALIARNEERLQKVKEECISLGSPRVEYYVCDISKVNEVKESVKQISNDFEKVDILINNAGIWHKLNQLENISDEEIDSVIDINLKGLIHLTKHILPCLKKETESALINVSSRSGVTAQLNQSLYSASKWGVTGFTEVLKVDLKGTNIRVAGLYQGKTQTDIFTKAGDSIDASNGTKPEDLADVIVFMLSRPPQVWLHDVRIEY
jgi:NADP-dependent 3-hydroxy acid dehydrogenase YdfG